MRDYTEYEAVKKFPIFQGYLEHFRETSIDNDIPGMLSFFFLQGQAAVPFVRIPWGPSHLDPRVHVFWIQPSRTGKSVAWEFVGDVARDSAIPTDMYTTGTDRKVKRQQAKSSDTDAHRPDLARFGDVFLQRYHHVM